MNTHTNGSTHTHTTTRRVRGPRKPQVLGATHTLLKKLTDTAKIPDPGVIATSVEAVREVATKLGIGPAIDATTRVLLAREGAVPDALLEIVAEVASEDGELIASHFDADAVTEARSYVLAMQPLRGVVRALLRQIDDEVIHRKAVVGNESRRLYKYLQVIADTPLGASIREPLDRMTSAMKKPRHKKAAAPAAAPAASAEIVKVP